ncbi:MAG: hypothetical protein R3E44_06430 [Paracoccaceae bacterium]
MTGKTTWPAASGGAAALAAFAIASPVAAQTVHATVYYKPAKKIQVGLEYISGERALFNGTSASAGRIQNSTRFNF